HGRRWRVKIAGAAVDQINVHPAVVVVIEKCAAGALGFGQIHLRRKAGYVAEVNAAGCGRDLLEIGRGWTRVVDAWENSLRESGCASAGKKSQELAARRDARVTHSLDQWTFCRVFSAA